MGSQEIITHLKDIFENTNRWLVFSESKNAVLIGANGIILKQMTSYLAGDPERSVIELIFCFSILGFSVISILIGLWSFYPKHWGTSSLETSESVRVPRNVTKTILMFYADIAQYNDTRGYLTDLYEHYFDTRVTEDHEFNKYHLDLAKEIIINSWITVRKNTYFKQSLRLTIVCIILAAVLLSVEFLIL